IMEGIKSLTADLTITDASPLNFSVDQKRLSLPSPPSTPASRTNVLRDIANIINSETDFGTSGRKNHAPKNVSKDYNPRVVTFTQGCCSFNLTPPSTPSNIYDEESIARQIAKLYVGPHKEQTPVEETISISKSGQGLFCFPPTVSKSVMRSITPSPVVTTVGHKSTLNSSEMFGCTWGALPSRWLYVSNFPTDVNLWRHMRSIFEIYGDVQEILAGIGYAYVIYYDLRDAVKAHQFLRHQDAPHNQRRLEIQFSSKPCAVQELPKIQGNECDWMNEGVIMVSWFGAQSIKSAILNRFDEVGTIRIAKSFSAAQNLVLLIEYYDTRAARAAKESINGIVIEGVQIRVQYYDAGSQSWDAVAEDFKRHQKTGLAIPPPPRQFPVAPSPDPENKSEDMAKFSPSPPENSTVISSGNRTIPEKNTLDLERIKNGILNFFLTISLILIRMLLDWLDETHRGQYDFVYLRIDFKNKCNVGYAFINFVDVNAVLSFAEVRVGKKWPSFNSDKICELSYANVQGKNALIQKFRNSGVMSETPEYRPKLFHTAGPLRGYEMPFPRPDNVEKQIVLRGMFRK
ncbi:36430_t:CDS:10, partial [Gigaspora margarita]